ncbi:MULTISPECIES: GMC oxidoreductase [unclassified Rathayibacter]|uniref:GMC oxidoreductase n=1 Tax=unclassified Rathayibacter TaxID=2609250 RepID=UPI00104FCE02|nr:MULTISPECIES: GMC oxidoreductase [unclassified Rathayibacter]TCL79458.1 choline dehydrogenase-like flavoprotein [Rathayibacter sp. PhB192]TCM25273.1 choline dehydrogenase-like flavoprotein [Rathayibacter sp. PhB179]
MITDVLIVGSGLMGAATARLIREASPDASIVMIDGGAVIGSVPGQHLHDSAEPLIHERYNARVASGVQALYTGAAVSSPVEGGMADVEPGMHHLSSLGEDAAALPGASLAWNVGGMGVHWTAACPAPWGREVPDFLPAAEWDADLRTAQRVLGVHDDAFGITDAGRAVLRELDAVFGPTSAEGRHPRTMPMAMTPTASGPRPRTGPNRILPAMADGSDPAFALLPGALCVRLEHRDGTVTGAIVRDVATGHESRLKAGIVVVCADTLRTPQLLFASGIRPAALGTHLNEHAFLTGRVFPDIARLGIDPSSLAAPREGEWAVGAYWLPHSDEAQPFHGQMMERPHVDDAGATVDYSVGLALYVPTEVRAANHVEFSETETDAMGLPRMRVHFDYSPRDEELIALARVRQREAAERIGRFDPERDTALLAPGSSLHFTGTVRMGPVDDGTSVCDTDARVWGFDNLYLAGNGVIPTPVTANSTLTGTTFAVRAARAVVAALTEPPVHGRLPEGITS